MARQLPDSEADRANRSRILELLQSARAAAEREDGTGAESAFTEAVALARGSGLRLEQAFCLQQLGQYRAGVGAASGARTAYEEGLELSCGLGSSDSLSLAANLLAGLGDLDVRENDDEAAFAHLAATLVLLQLGEPSACDLALRITPRLHETLSTRPAAADRAARRASDLYSRLVRAPLPDPAPRAFADALTMALSELVGRAAIMRRPDGAALCLETLKLCVERQGDAKLARLSLIRGLRNALVFYGRSGDRPRAERCLAEINEVAAGVPEDAAAQEQLAASLVSILHYRLAAGVPAVGIAALVARLRALRARFPEDPRFAAHLAQAEQQSGFRRRGVSKRDRTLIDRALASPEGLADLYQQLDPSLIETLVRRREDEHEPDVRERLAALERMVEHFCDTVSGAHRGATEGPASRPPQAQQPRAGDAHPVSAYRRGNMALFEYLQTRDPKHLDLAVSLLERALTEEGTDDRTRTHARFLLGQSLVGRYDTTADFADLEWGLRHLLPAVEATPADDPERAKRLEFFANSLLKALDRFSPVEIRSALGRGHLRAVISSLEESVRLTPSGDPALPWRLSSLALALKRRFEASADVEALPSTTGSTPAAVDDLDAARDTLLRAVAVASAPEQLEGLHGNLGAVLMLRHRVTGDAGALSAAVDAFRYAAAASPPGSPSRAHHLQNLARALALTDANPATVDQAFAEAFHATPGRGSPSLQIQDPMSASPRPGLEFLLERGARAEEQGRWAEAVQSYAEAQRLLDGLFGAQVTRRFQTRQLGESLDIPVKHAYALARAGDSAAAMTALERGRARLLSETLTFPHVDPDRFEAAGRPDLGKALSTAAADLRRLQHAALDPASAANLLGGDEVRAARRRLQRITSEIDTVPALHALVAPPTAADVRRLLAGQPVVYLAAAERGGMALVVPADPDAAVTTVLLDELTAEAASDYASRFHDANRSRSEDHGRWMAAIDDVCEWLWCVAMGPLLDTLRAAETPEFALVPCGWLGLLPVHAAWTRDDARPVGRRYAIDEAAITYAPNARALATARSRAAARRLLDAALVVTVPEAPGTDANRLAATRSESEEICHLLPGASVLTAGEATSDRVLQALGTCTLAHFACHGRSVPAQPLNSSLLLGDGELKAHALMACRLDNTRLAVLSACETAVPGRDAPEESVGLPAAFLQAGSAGVIASLWAVPDRSTALLMRMFYRGLVAEGLPPAVALRSAQVRLRDATNGDLAAGGLIAPPANLPRAAMRLWQAGRPFCHPYYWAAFGCTGA